MYMMHGKKVVSILDANHNEITDTNHIGHINPIRYRGYYYDVETSFYYLQSRYYNPEVGRFINIDSEISSVGESVLGYNLYTYCMNNPVNMSDSTGNWPKFVGEIAAVATAALALVAFTSIAPAAICTLATIGMAIGASSTVATTVATTFIASTAIAATAYSADIAYSTITGESLLLNTVFQGNETAYNIGFALMSFATMGVI